MGRPRSRPDLTNVRDPLARDLIDQLLANDPADRPSAIDVLDHEFLKRNAGARVEPLSDFKDRSVKNFFLNESPSKLHPRHCACIAPAHCPHRPVARAVEKGEVLFNEGDRSRAVYFIATGAFHLFRKGKLYARLERDCVVGEIGALFDRPRRATCIASEDSEVFEFKDFGEKLGSTQQRYALKGLKEMALKDILRDTTREFLQSSTLFKNASDELLDMIVAGCEHQHFNQGEMVLSEEHDKSALFIVQEGLFESRAAAKSYVSFIGPGEIVGEMALIFGQSGGESLRALKPTTALVLDRSEFALILTEFPKERELIVALAEQRLQELGVPAFA